ncbi:hypothetical protein D3C86_1649410 [compost metagenome]
MLAAGQQLRGRRQVDGVFVPLQHLQRLPIDKVHGGPSGFGPVHPPYIPAQAQRQQLCPQANGEHSRVLIQTASEPLPFDFQPGRAGIGFVRPAQQDHRIGADGRQLAEVGAKHLQRQPSGFGPDGDSARTFGGVVLDQVQRGHHATLDGTQGRSMCRKTPGIASRPILSDGAGKSVGLV